MAETKKRKDLKGIIVLFYDLQEGGWFFESFEEEGFDVEAVKAEYGPDAEITLIEYPPEEK